MKRLLTIILTALVLVGVSVANSAAGSKIIKPYELQPFQSDQSYVKWPTYVRSATTSVAHFYAIVKLPVGKTIKKLEHYHGGNDDTASTRVYLNRYIPGESPLEQMAWLHGSGAGFENTETNSINFAKIKRGYIYFLQATSNNNSSSIEGIKITYK